MRSLLLFPVVLVAVIFAGSFTFAQQTGGSGSVKQTDNAPVYEEIAKIFDLRCVSCHSGARPPEGLRLDNYKNVMTGGKGGTVVIPGRPSESKLFKAVRGELKPRMPKNGPPWLTDIQVDLIERWISVGSPDVQSQ